MESFDTDKLKASIPQVPDFPVKGIGYYDITPVLRDPELMNIAAESMCDILHKNSGTDASSNLKIVSIDARGFIFGSLLAHRYQLPHVLARKPGKLPKACAITDVKTEYSATSLAVQLDDIQKGDRIILVDDVLATGGTIKALRHMLTYGMGATCVYGIVLLDLGFEGASGSLSIHSVVAYGNKRNFYGR